MSHKFIGLLESDGTIRVPDMSKVVEIAIDTEFYGQELGETPDADEQKAGGWRWDITYFWRKDQEMHNGTDRADWPELLTEQYICYETATFAEAVREVKEECARYVGDAYRMEASLQP